jgi:hypothetical protein
MASDLSGRRIQFQIDRNPFGDTVIPLEFEIISGDLDDKIVSATSYLPMGQSAGQVFTFTQCHGRTVTINFQGALLLSNLPWETIPAGSLVQKVRITLNRGGDDADGVIYDESFHQFDYARVLHCRHLFDTTTHQMFEVQMVAHGTATLPTTAYFG